MKKTIFGWTIKSSSRSFDVHQFFPITNLHGIEQLKWSLNRLDDLEHINLHCHRTRMRIIIKSINRRQFFSSFFRFCFSIWNLWSCKCICHGHCLDLTADKIFGRPKKKKTLKQPMKTKQWVCSVNALRYFSGFRLFHLSLLFWILIDARCALHSIILRLPSTICW